MVKSDFKKNMKVFGMKMLKVILSSILIIISREAHISNSLFQKQVLLNYAKSNNDVFQNFERTSSRDRQTTLEAFCCI